MKKALFVASFLFISSIGAFFVFSLPAYAATPVLGLAVSYGSTANASRIDLSGQLSSDHLADTVSVDIGGPGIATTTQAGTLLDDRGNWSARFSTITTPGVYTIAATAASITGDTVTEYSTIRVNKINQHTTLDAIIDQVYGTASFAVNATSDSGLPVTLDYSGTCTLSASTTGALLTLGSVGACSISATQAGNDTYLPASTVIHSFNITKAPPSVVLTTTSTQYSRSAHVIAAFSDEVTGFSDSSVVLSDHGLSITNFEQLSSTTYAFDVVDGGSSVDATLVVPSGVATSTADGVSGNDASNVLAFSFYANYIHDFVSASTDVNDTHSLPAYVNAPFTAYAIFNTSNPIADFTAGDVAATNATISDVATTSQSGGNNIFSFVVTPQQEGAVSVSLPGGVVAMGYGNLATNALATTYDITPPAIAVLGSSTPTVELGSVYTDAGATSSDNFSGDLTASVRTSGSVDTSTLGVYTLTYQVSDAAGNTASTTRTVTVVKKSQGITFDTLVDKTVGDAAFDVSATSSSGLPLTFAASGSCSVATTTVSIAGAGSCTVTATQPGNDEYAASSVSQSFSIVQPRPASGGGGGGGGGSNGPVLFSAIVPQVSTTVQAGEVLGAESYRFTNYLVRGSRGDAVTNLQKLLIAKKLLAPDSATGYFGALTQKAVIAYQKLNKIAQTGTVGPQTRAALNKENFIP